MTGALRETLATKTRYLGAADLYFSAEDYRTVKVLQTLAGMGETAKEKPSF